MRPGFATALLLLLGYGFMATGGPSLLTALGPGAPGRHAEASAAAVSSVEARAAPTSPAGPTSPAPKSPLLRAALDDHSCHHCIPACFEGRGHVCMGAAPSGGDLVSMDVASEGLAANAASSGASSGDSGDAAGDSSSDTMSPDEPGDRALGGVRIAPRPCRPLDGTPAASTFASLDLRHVTATPFLSVPSGDRERVLAGSEPAPESRVDSPEAPPPRRA